MRVSEVYLSVQGEGPNVGTPTVFVRFGGCNLRCPLWPCDTPYAIFPEYRKEWLVQDVDTIYHRILEVAKTCVSFNVCFTGGEPFLQKHDDLYALYSHLETNWRIGHIEAFSNGALEYPDWLQKTDLEVVMDWKLPGSGEGEFSQTRLDNIHQRLRMNQLALKFTIADRHDYDVAKEYWGAWGHGYQTFAGIVWGKMSNQELVEWILEDGLPWRLNVQVHNHVWDRSMRGI